VTQRLGRLFVAGKNITMESYDAEGSVKQSRIHKAEGYPGSFRIKSK
jgi:hypothetical protein